MPTSADKSLMVSMLGQLLIAPHVSLAKVGVQHFRKFVLLLSIDGLVSVSWLQANIAKWHSVLPYICCSWSR